MASPRIAADPQVGAGILTGFPPRRCYAPDAVLHRARPIMNSPVDPLDELLNRCRPAPEPPPQLAAKIRRRLAGRRGAPLLTWMAQLDAVFARPSFAATFITACMLLGLFLAETRVSRLHAAQSAQIARSYLRMIDPLFGPNPATSPTVTSSP